MLIDPGGIKPLCRLATFFGASRDIKSVIGVKISPDPGRTKYALGLVVIAGSAHDIKSVIGAAIATDMEGTEFLFVKKILLVHCVILNMSLGHQ